MHERCVPIEGGIMETASGEKSPINRAVWICVEVAGTTRVVAALVTHGRPCYHLLLGRHWMADVKLVGDYQRGEYTLEDDCKERTSVPRITDKDMERVKRQAKVLPVPVQKAPIWVDISDHNNMVGESIPPGEFEVSDIGESEVDRCLRNALRSCKQQQEHQTQSGMESMESYSGDSESGF
ncbi:hypothetical protein N7466_003248 [Penicillium verhagenii]|uniref:uncharacterized protein n=1 Tax=Penicillium verhagenii TaxID=1562060 RepID=UPI002544D6B3|nr:uncharacterized protein N7466_003248 [Penicillium verhagenii]KAJ5936798.1 hypothetical protein N7466_003248 [Penicillium verhagenii]